MSATKILIVEDEVITSEVIADQLGQLGYTVTDTVTSGTAALASIAKTLPDLVLMDIVLKKGDIDGVTCAARIREQFRIPVVYLTAHSDEATLNRAKATEAFGYIVKPFDDRDLRTAIEMALEKHRKERLFEDVMTRAITEHKLAEAQIKASLQQKEVLLKEIHHRVKNNFQIIASLLNLHSGSVKDQQALEILKAGETRVNSMALVHEQLYQSQDLGQINFAAYIQVLAANLFDSYEVSSNAIALKINSEDIQLSIDAAIPCGLIINELVLNCLKYAFPSGRKGEVCIKFHKDNNNQLLLVVSDNGIGLPPNFDFQNTESLGLQIVVALVNQLSGTIMINRSIGTEFKITFPE
jgi:two-component sensor histidine kinase/CheY-like chemotaxis protein